MEYEKLPENAKEIRIPENNMTVSFVFAIPFIILMFVSLHVKSLIGHEFPLNRPYAAIGIVAGLLLVVVHEFLHACVYPKGATAYIGVIPGKFMAYTCCAAPLRKDRFILMSLLPVLLGIVPYVLFLLCPIGGKIAAAIFSPCAMIGFIAPCPDYLNVFCVCRQVPDGAYIQDGDDGMF